MIKLGLHQRKQAKDKEQKEENRSTPEFQEVKATLDQFHCKEPNPPR